MASWLASRKGLLWALALIALPALALSGSARGDGPESSPYHPAACPPVAAYPLVHPRAPCPAPSIPGVPQVPQVPQVPPVPPVSPQAEPPPAPAEPEFPALEAGTVAGAEGAFVPNMLGNLLFASRSITFSYSRAAGLINVQDPGATSIVNSIIADNNSPVPRDRVGFRYNHFDNAQSITGFGPAVVPPGGVVGIASGRTRDYDLNRYTFNIEKTFFDRLMSVEFRLPFSTTVNNNLALIAGQFTGAAVGANGQPILTPNGPAFNVVSTPDQTLGSGGTNLENLSLIFKGLLYRSPRCALSAGLGVGIPTAPETTVRVIDFAGTATAGQASIQRERIFRIDNKTWSFSPFLAFLATPTDRLFTQGFAQVDFPISDSTIIYTDQPIRGRIPNPPPLLLAGSNFLATPFTVNSRISEQMLLHLDWGLGGWVLRDSSPNRCVTGIAPTFELHYTSTLDNAEIVTLPVDGLITANGTLEAPPRVGSRRNRVDLLDVTMGTTVLLSDRATLAAGVGLPLKGGDNRTYDWEFHLQFNWFFGGITRPFAPNF
jgi:hypothetical protein